MTNVERMIEALKAMQSDEKRQDFLSHLVHGTEQYIADREKALFAAALAGRMEDVQSAHDTLHVTADYTNGVIESEYVKALVGRLAKEKHKEFVNRTAKDLVSRLLGLKPEDVEVLEARPNPKVN